MNIGIMGGTFDPIHNGHLMLGEYAYRQFDLDEIWFMPNGNPPHKSDPQIIKDTADRLNMTKLAIEDIPYFRLCTFEIDRREKSYSYSTFQKLGELFPEHKFYFIIGADSLYQIETWKHPELLIPHVTILAAYRDDIDTPEAIYRQIDYLNDKYNGDIRLLKTPVLPVSSHEIRNMLKADSRAGIPVPDKVRSYIQEQHLYQGDIHE